VRAFRWSPRSRSRRRWCAFPLLRDPLQTVIPVVDARHPDRAPGSCSSSIGSGGSRWRSTAS
jgi:hypothetical protein